MQRYFLQCETLYFMMHSRKTGSLREHLYTEDGASYLFSFVTLKLQVKHYTVVRD